METVDAEGLLTAVGAGDATVTATSADGNCQASCLVTVKDDSGVDGVLTDEVYTVFNLQGMLLLKGVGIEEVERLPAGVYIVNGKKTLLR